MHIKTGLISIFLSLLFLSDGCSVQTPRKIGNDIQIPDNGLISEEILKEIKENNLVTVFKGSSNGYSYEWTVFGNKLEKTDEIDLHADILIKENAQTEIVLHGSSSPFSSMISVHTGLDLRGIHFDAYETENDKQKKCSTVTVTGEEKSILNFSPGKLSGKYILKPETEASESPVSKTTAKTNKTKSKKETLSSTTTRTACTVCLSDSISESETVLTEDKNNSKSEEITENPAVSEPNNETVLTENDESEPECTVLVECTTVFSNLSKLEPGIIDTIPSNGIILEQTKVKFSEGESVFDVIKRLCTENKIHFEFEHVPLYNSSYITAFNNLYEFDCGNLSGWLYSVNGWFPNYGSSCYELKDNDVIEWRYSCDLGKDVNGGQTVNQYQ